MKIALCCIVKNENLYLREFINYYKDLGVDTFIIYDNNNSSGENIYESIPENTNIGIIDIKDKQCMQLPVYTDCYKRFGDLFDWILFVDADEFLVLEKNSNLYEFLSDPKFDSFNMIHINWMCYGDNGLVKYDNRLMIERFDMPVLPLDFKKNYLFPENNHIKSIIRGHLNISLKWSNPHTPSNISKCCDADGNKIDGSSPWNNYNFNTAYFKHFTTKTIEEYYYKRVRGYPDGPIEYAYRYITADSFFKYNTWTQEKQDIWDNLINNKTND